MRRTGEADINDSEKSYISNKTADNLAIASLVLAVIAMFGVIPLSGFPFIISCAMIDWDGCTNLDPALEFFSYACFSSIAASILAIILGFISYSAAEKDSTTGIIAVVSIGIGIIVWPLALVTGFILWLGSMW